MGKTLRPLASTTQSHLTVAVQTANGAPIVQAKVSLRRANNLPVGILAFFLVRFQEVPADSIGPGIELTYAVEWNYLMQFTCEGLE